MKKPASRANQSGANVGYEAQLWQMADALRGSMDATEYKHVVLGLLFLKYVGVLESALDELAVGGRPKGGVSDYVEGVRSIGAENIVGVGIFDYARPNTFRVSSLHQ